MTVSKIGLTGSVTIACNVILVIGRRNPAIDSAVPSPSLPTAGLSNRNSHQGTFGGFQEYAERQNTEKDESERPQSQMTNDNDKPSSKDGRRQSVMMKVQKSEGATNSHTRMNHDSKQASDEGKEVDGMRAPAQDHRFTGRSSYDDSKLIESARQEEASPVPAGGYGHLGGSPQRPLQ